MIALVFSNEKTNDILKVVKSLEGYGLLVIRVSQTTKNLDQFKSIRTYWIVLYVNANNIVYFNSFGVEHIPK